MNRLSKTRRKRAVPGDWATGEVIENFKPAKSSKPTTTRPRAVATHGSGDLVLFGGEDGQVCVYSTSQDKVVENFAVRAAVTDTLWAGDTAVVATTTGTVEGYEAGARTFSFTAHTGEVTGLALHPCGDLLASVGADKCYTFYDLTSSSQVLRLPTSSGKESYNDLQVLALT